MNAPTQYRDTDIRILLMEHIAQSYSGVEHFVALEARYAAKERRADILVVADHSHAYEIKSDVDRVDRLPEQIKDYRQTFDYLTVVTTPTHAGKIRNMLGKNDGLIIISDKGLHIIRHPKRNKRIAKKNMIFICSKPVLANALNLSCGSLSLDKIRALAEKSLSLPDLRLVAFKELKRKFKSKYDVFLTEACIPYRESDLALLQHNDRLSTSMLLA